MLLVYRLAQHPSNKVILLLEVVEIFYRFLSNLNIDFKYFPVSDYSFSVPNCSVESKHYCIIQRSQGETIGGKNLKLTEKTYVTIWDEIVILFRTVSPRLGNNDKLKWCSNNFPYITYMSPLLFLNFGEKVKKVWKLWYNNFTIF